MLKRTAVFVDNGGVVCYNVAMEVRVKAYAKLNLTLDITGVIDGWHMLDSLVCTVDTFDLIKIKKRKDRLVSVIMHGRGTELLPPENNNAAKAAEAFVSAFGTGGADITVFKNIPVGAGMGGSSADAAGVLNGMARLYGVGGERDLKALADTLGSDTGYMLSGGFARLTGRGEKVENLGISRRLNVLMLVPEGGVSTPLCYKEYDKLPQCAPSTKAALDAIKAGDTARLGAALDNALYAPATRLNAGVKRAFEELESFSPCGVNMTGSGSGVYALFETPELCDWAKSRYRGKAECFKLRTV